MKRQLFLISFLLLSVSTHLSAQKTNIHKSPDDTYRQALEFYNKQLYSVSFDRFQETADQLRDKESLKYAECRYFMAMCSYELLNKDAEYQLISFIKDFPENSRVETASFYLANIQFREKRFRKAYEQYCKTGSCHIG
jgi:hypothetical protein